MRMLGWQSRALCFAAVSSVGLGCGDDQHHQSVVAEQAVTTRIENTSNAVSYWVPAGSSNWFINSNAMNSGGSRATHAEKGVSATLTFDGTAVTYIAFKDPWSGIAKVYLDGNAVADVDLYDPSDKYQVPVYTASNL